jgi:hypothetical protein
MDLLHHATTPSILSKAPTKEPFLGNGTWTINQCELEARKQSIAQFLTSFGDGVESGAYPVTFGLYLKALSIFLTFFRLYQPTHSSWATGFESLRRFEKLELPIARRQPLRLRVRSTPVESGPSPFTKALIGATLSAIVLFGFNVAD